MTLSYFTLLIIVFRLINSEQANHKRTVPSMFNLFELPPQKPPLFKPHLIRYSVFNLIEQSEYIR